MRCYISLGLVCLHTALYRRQNGPVCVFQNGPVCFFKIAWASAPFVDLRATDTCNRITHICCTQVDMQSGEALDVLSSYQLCLCSSLFCCTKFTGVGRRAWECTWRQMIQSLQKSFGHIFPATIFHMSKLKMQVAFMGTFP